MRSAKISEKEMELRRVLGEIRREVARLEGEVVRWRGRAERCRGEAAVLEEAVGRLRADNQRLAEQLVQVSANAMERLERARPDLGRVLEEFRRTVQPEVVYGGRDGGEEQRRGIDWGDQGLDNSGGTPEGVGGPFDFGEPVSVPDYVLDVERMDPKEVRGSRGGWYNPA